MFKFDGLILPGKPRNFYQLAVTFGYFSRNFWLHPLYMRVYRQRQPPFFSGGCAHLIEVFGKHQKHSFQV